MIGQSRSLAAFKGDMPTVLPILESIHDIGQTRGCFGQVGGIDLSDVAQANHLGARPGPCDQGFHLL